VVRCRLCRSANVDKLPFDLPPGYPVWLRCLSCGSDTTVAEAENSPQDLSETGEIRPPTQSAQSYCEWLSAHQHLGDRIFLDVGCGNGAILDAMKTSGWEVHGFDFVPRAALQHTLTVAPMFHRWLFSHRFDAIFCQNILERVESPDFFLHELHGACIPGGLVLIETVRPLVSSENVLDLTHAYRANCLCHASASRLRAMLAAAMLDIIEERCSDVTQLYLCRARG
jgi:SAM-dependent methyltransferase